MEALQQNRQYESSLVADLQSLRTAADQCASQTGTLNEDLKCLHLCLLEWLIPVDEATYEYPRPVNW